jgi:hypothetical protein
LHDDVFIAAIDPFSVRVIVIQGNLRLLIRQGGAIVEGEPQAAGRDADLRPVGDGNVGIMTIIEHR